MAQNRIIFEVVAEGKNLKVVQRDVEAIAEGVTKTGAARDKAGTSQRDYNKREKAIYQGNLASAKSFSKLSESIAGSGSSALVNAYATLAANLFAATAAFRVFKDAADIANVEKGLEFIGNELGTNLGKTAKALQEVTAYGISSAEAMRSVALATKSGFSEKQILGLGKVAKGASIALGRDMTDAMSRLTRGVAKLEPEILDELGIIVRLDEATRKYASALGKTSKELTASQRVQAFANAVTEQGLKAYGNLADAIDTSPFDKFSAALSNNSKDLLKWINSAAGLGGALEYLAGSAWAMAGVAVTFLGSISRQLLPVLFKMPVAMAEAAISTKNNSAELLKGTIANTKFEKSLASVVTGVKDGSLTRGDIINKISAVVKARDSAAKKLESAQRGLAAGRKGSSNERVLEYQEQLNVSNKVLKQLNETVEDNAAASRKMTAANSIAAASNLEVRNSWKLLKEAVAGHHKDLIAANKTFVRTRVGLLAVATSVRAVGAAFLTLIPYIGILLAFGPMLIDWFQKTFLPESEMEKKEKEIKEFSETVKENLSHIPKSIAQFELNYKDPGFERTAAGIKLLSGLMSSLSSETSRIITETRVKYAAVAEENTVKFREKLEELQDIQQNIAENPWLFTIRKGIEDIFPALDWLIEKTRLWNWLNVETADSLIERRKEVLDLQKKTREDTAGSQREIIAGMQTAIDSLTRQVRSSSLGRYDSAAAGIVEALEQKRAALEKLKEKVGTPGVDNDIDKIQINIDEITRQIKFVEDAYTGAGSAIERVNQAIFNYNKRADTPFTPIIAEVTELKNRLNSGELTEAGLIKDLKILKENLGPELIKALGTTNIDAFLNKLLDTEDKIRNLNANVGEFESKKKAIESLGIDNRAVAEEIVVLEQQILDTKIEALRVERDSFANDSKKKELQLQINALKDEKMVTSLKLLEVDKEIEVIQKRMFENLRTEVELIEQKAKFTRDLAELFNYTDTSSTAKNEFKLAKQSLANKKSIYLVEQQLDRDKFERERDSHIEQLDAMLKYEREKRKKDQDRINSLEKIRSVAQASYEAESAHLDNIRDKRLELMELEERALNLKYLKLKPPEVGGSSVNFLSKYNDLENFKDAAKDAFEVGDITKLEARLLILGKTLEVFRNQFSEVMSEFGTKGELANSIYQLSEVVTTSFLQAFNSISTIFEQVRIKFATEVFTMGDAWDKMDWKEKTAVVAQGLNFGAKILSGFSAVMQAASADRVAGIDSEIAAEQKRDGKSAASVAKIQALEAKKEKAQRKAFETKKKMTMAEIVMATAAAIMEYAKIPVYGWIMAAAVAALGAAQLAVVAGSSYQGGGSSISSPSGPKAISVGERSNKVDVSKRATSGELSYLQGDAGIGNNANKFRTAFVGTRHRASGGYIVGEQGPELFTPEVPGVITPSSEIKASNPVNVTFQISAIDASNMKQMLDNQKGNIIDMIRQAANSHGEQFLESVDTMSLAPVRTGYGRLA